MDPLATIWNMTIPGNQPPFVPKQVVPVGFFFDKKGMPTYACLLLSTAKFSECH